MTKLGLGLGSKIEAKKKDANPAIIGVGISGVDGLSVSGVFSGGQSRNLTHWRNRTA